MKLHIDKSEDEEFAGLNFLKVRTTVIIPTEFVGPFIGEFAGVIAGAWEDLEVSLSGDFTFVTHKASLGITPDVNMEEWAKEKAVIFTEIFNKLGLQKKMDELEEEYHYGYN
jgi:hypothetical protein